MEERIPSTDSKWMAGSGSGDSLRNAFRNIFPVPVFSESSLSSALTTNPPKPLPTEPPRSYNPYPYSRTWKPERRVTNQELWLWHHREDDWSRHIDGEPIPEVRARIWQTYTAGIKERQHAAKKDWEEAKAMERPPLVPEAEGDGVSHSGDVRFETVDGEMGIPVKALISGRRVLQNLLRFPGLQPFEEYKHDTIRIRIKWPAYPDHETVRNIFITVRTGKKRIVRRPCTSLEFCIALGSFFTQYYAEVSRMEPHPAFTHLALGPGEGRISLYGLRLMGIRSTPGETFDVDLQLDTSKPQPQPQSPPTAGPSSSAPTTSSTPAPKEEDPSASTSTTTGSTSAPSTNARPGPDPGPSPEEENRAKTPPWAGTLPVTCTVAAPPKLAVWQYQAHVTPTSLQKHAVPHWVEPQ